MVNPSLAVDPDHDLSVEDLEETIYAYLAQADLALEAMDANTSVEQPVADKEAEGRMKAGSTAAEAAKAKSEKVAVPTTLGRPSDASTVPAGAAETPTGVVKRSLSGVSAPSSKRPRRKPVVLGTRDG